MSADVLLLSALAGIAVLFSLGVLVSKDNFYSSLYMSGTLIFVAAVYALFNLQPVFVLIVFIFVGAIGIVTVALAATYRSEPVRQVSVLWAAPVALAAFLIGFSIYSYPIFNPPAVSTGEIKFELINFLPTTEYFLVVILLITLVILLLLSVLKMGIGGKS
jgi:NADH-quinone oxidoreductase subunit J